MYRYFILKYFPAIFVFIYGISALIEIQYLKKEKYQGRKVHCWIFNVSVAVYILSSVLSLFEVYYFKRILNRYLFVFGLCLIILKFSIKLISAKQLKEFWSTHIEIRQNHMLVKKWPYSMVRHPGYLSTVIEISAIPVILNAPYTFLLTFILYAVVVNVRAELEENEMEEYFKDEYISYKKKTYKFIPYLY